jgi:hypothetical protein
MLPNDVANYTTTAASNCLQGGYRVQVHVNNWEAEDRRTMGDHHEVRKTPGRGNDTRGKEREGRK